MNLLINLQVGDKDSKKLWSLKRRFLSVL